MSKARGQRNPQYYVRTGEGADALGIALDSWAENGGWQGLSIFRLSYGDSPDAQKQINERAQALVDAANRGLSQSVEISRLQQSNAALAHELNKLVVKHSDTLNELDKAVLTIRDWHTSALAMRDMAVKGEHERIDNYYFDTAMKLPFYGAQGEPLPSAAPSRH